MLLFFVSPSIFATTIPINIKDFLFKPNSITINITDHVKWTNRKTHFHTQQLPTKANGTAIRSYQETRLLNVLIMQASLPIFRDSSRDGWHSHHSHSRTNQNQDRKRHCLGKSKATSDYTESCWKEPQSGLFGQLYRQCARRMCRLPQLSYLCRGS